MGWPAILMARSAARHERVLRRAAARAVDLSPSSLIAGAVGDLAGDLIGDRHLYRTGSAAPAARAVAAGAGIWSMRTTVEIPDTWEAAPGDYNFGVDPWAFLIIAGFRARGGGSWCLGNLVGPNPDDPYFTDTVAYGTDRGYGVTSNGDGGMGFAIAGDTGNYNADVAEDAVDLADRQVGAYVFGYSVAARTGYLRSARLPGLGIAQAANDAAPTRQGRAPGDITSEGRFALRCDWRARRVCGASWDVLLLAVYEGAAAENVYAYHLDFLPMLQADLDASSLVLAA